MSATNAQRAQAATMLAAGITQAEVAAAVGVTTRTIRRWMREDPAFADMLRGCGDALIDAVRRRLQGHGLTFVDSLAEIARDGEDPKRPGRASAADRGLRHLLGERRQIEHSGGIATDDAGRLDSIEAERAALLAELGEE